MLKIIDDFDLKNLAAYGFKYEATSDCYVNLISDGTAIYVYQYNRSLKFIKENIFHTRLDEVLFELFTDGLVDKYHE